MKIKMQKEKSCFGMLLLTVAFLVLTPYPSLAQFLVEKIQNNGNDDNRMVWVIMGDGYTSPQLDDFHQNVDNIIDKIFSTSPWSGYKNFINVYRIDVISNESGADHPSSSIYVNTALDATFDTYGISRLLTVDDSKAFDVASEVPSFDAVMVLVNDQQYGGSGGATIAFSNHEKAGLIALHEIGHLIGDLADEYETPYPGYPEGDSEPNVTYQTEYEHIKWKNWIEGGTPLPTPEDNDYGTGLYEGARYLSEGIYRPNHNCIMRSLGVPYCPICSEALVLSLYNYVDLIDSQIPNLTNLFLSSDLNTIQFRIELVDPSSDTVGMGWEIDGTVQQNENSNTLTVDMGTITKGAHKVTVLAADFTSLVRNDPHGVLLSSRSWNLEKESVSGVIEGIVVNAVTQQDIEGILIETQGGEYSTTSGADGGFKLSPVNEGIYDITTNSERYNPFSRSNIAVTDGEITTIDISLEPRFTTYSISGNVLGSVKEGITVELKKGDRVFLSAATDIQGKYFFNGVESGSYIVIPTLSDYNLIPPLHELEVDNRDLTNINFEILAGPCPAEVLLEEQPSSLDLLRTFRDSILAKNGLGKHYTRLYYEHAAELASLIKTQEDIKVKSAELLMELIPTIAMRIDRQEMVLGEGVRGRINALIGQVERYASPPLKEALTIIKRDLRSKRVLSQLGVISQ